ncbi:MAG TPA: 30S ribosomal protein S17 [Candidatus Paceibacterota bacterium]|nr:30S ribosomal protein S17 [Candidatus Paceibacterota bacterium]
MPSQEIKKAHKASLRTIEGTIISDKMQKTVVVEVTTLKKHPLYRKYIKTHKHFKADNPDNLYKIGDQVVLGAVSKPISHDKRWSVIKKVN